MLFVHQATGQGGRCRLLVCHEAQTSDWSRLMAEQTLPSSCIVWIISTETHNRLLASQQSFGLNKGWATGIDAPRSGYRGWVVHPTLFGWEAAARSWGLAYSTWLWWTVERTAILYLWFWARENTVIMLHSPTLRSQISKLPISCLVHVARGCILGWSRK